MKRKSPPPSSPVFGTFSTFLAVSVAVSGKKRRQPCCLPEKFLCRNGQRRRRRVWRGEEKCQLRGAPSIVECAASSLPPPPPPPFPSFGVRSILVTREEEGSFVFISRVRGTLRTVRIVRSAGKCDPENLRNFSRKVKTENKEK